MSFLIQKSPDQCLFAAPRSLSQLITSFFGSQCQGIRPAPFLAWPFAQSWFFHLPTRVSRNCRFLYQSFVFSNLRSSCSVFKVHSAVWTSFSFSEEVVGSSGLEPPTSRLSGARSNRLSYKRICLRSFASSLLLRKKWWRWGESNSWPPACKAGALPSELHPHMTKDLDFFEDIAPSKLNNVRLFDQSWILT